MKKGILYKSDVGRKGHHPPTCLSKVYAISHPKQNKKKRRSSMLPTTDRESRKKIKPSLFRTPQMQRREKKGKRLKGLTLVSFSKGITFSSLLLAIPLIFFKWRIKEDSRQLTQDRHTHTLYVAAVVHIFINTHQTTKYTGSVFIYINIFIVTMSRFVCWRRKREYVIVSSITTSSQ